MSQAVLEWGRATKRALSDGVIAPSKLVSWSQVSSHDDRLDYARLLQKSDWTGLSSAAAAAESRESKLVAEMSTQQRRLARRMEVLLGPPSEVHEALGGLQGRPDWADIRKAALDELSRRGGDEQAMAWLAQNLDAGIDFLKAMVAPLKDSAGQLDDLATIHLRVLSGATLARLVAAFNVAAAAGKGPRIDPMDACAAAEGEVQRIFTRLWQACAARKPRSAARAAKELSALGQPAQPVLQNLLLAAAEQASRQSSVARAGVQIRIGDCLRALLTAVCIGRWVSWTLLRHDPYMGSNRVFGRAEDLPAFAPLAAPTVLDLDEVARDPASYDGQVVTIQGVVSGAVTAVGDVSTAQLRGTTGSIAVRTDYVRLDEAGVCDGACVRATGTVHLQGGDVSLTVGYDDLDQASASSFHGWLRGQTGQIFRAVPHDLLLSTSWQPGFDGAGNQLRYGIWFT